MVSGVQRTLDRSTERTYQERTAGASERRVRTSRLREREKDLRETDQVSLEKYLGFFLNSGKESDLNGSSMKTLRVCLARTEDLTSCRYSVKWIGGYDIEWQVFNSKDFGVPQNRERVYTIGHLRANGTRKIFPIQAADGENCTPIELIGHRDGYHKNLQTYSPDGITETLDTCGGGAESITSHLIGGYADSAHSDGERLQGDRQPGHDRCFGIDKSVYGEPRPVANALTAREDRGVSKQKQTGTAIAYFVGD